MAIHRRRDGRGHRAPRDRLRPDPDAERAASQGRREPAAVDGAHVGRSLLAGPLLLLGFAIAAYVASEVGVSNWIVRFLEPAP